jgi:hypothetical protein
LAENEQSVDVRELDDLLLTTLMARFFLVLLLALTGCASQLNPHDTLRLKHFDDAGELRALTEAIAEWNTAVPKLNLRPAGRGEDGDWTVERYDFEGDKFGNTTRWKAHIRIDAALLRKYYPNAPLDHLKSTMLHELGHALGMKGHRATGLMRPQHSGQTCIDADTLAWLLHERPELTRDARTTC